MTKEFGRQLKLQVDENNNLAPEDPEWGLPPKPKHEPTLEEIREYVRQREDTVEQLRKLRARVPSRNPRGYNFRIKAA